MEEIKSCKKLRKIGIESEIVDLNAEIVGLEQRLSLEGLGQDEIAYLNQELACRYDALDRYNAMLKESEESENTSVRDFKKYKSQKKQTYPATGKTTRKSDLMIK